MVGARNKNSVANSNSLLCEIQINDVQKVRTNENRYPALCKMHCRNEKTTTKNTITLSAHRNKEKEQVETSSRYDYINQMD